MRNQETISLESVFPGEELFFRQLVDLAGLLDRDRAPPDCGDNRGLTTYYPSAGVRRWQTFSEQGLDQRIIKRRFHGAVGRRCETRCFLSAAGGYVPQIRN